MSCFSGALKRRVPLVLLLAREAATVFYTANVKLITSVCLLYLAVADLNCCMASIAIETLKERTT